MISTRIVNMNKTQAQIENEEFLSKCASGGCDVDLELYTEGLWNYIHERNDTALFARDGLQVSSLGHEQFADKIIIPFLNSKGVY